MSGLSAHLPNCSTPGLCGERDSCQGTPPCSSASEPEFSAELVERCASKMSAAMDGWFQSCRTSAPKEKMEAFVARAIIRESGHADLVAALKLLLDFVGYRHMTDDQLCEEARLGNRLAPDILKARKALRKAGAIA